MADATAAAFQLPFAQLAGIEITAASKDQVRGRMEWREEICTLGGVVHGGALMTLADTVGAACAFLNLPSGASTATIESKTNLLRAVRGGHVEATATPVHVGRTMIVVQTDLRDDQGRRVALTTQTQAVIPGG
jgi:1,4-dihydroxy-2-naphthoyl-CoA hydrolase